MKPLALVLLLGWATLGCGDLTIQTPATGPIAPQRDGGTDVGSPAADGEVPIGAVPNDAGAVDAYAATPSPFASLGALVVLGDSISSGGGEPPFYFDLLRQKLEVHYGPIAFSNRAQSGATSSALAAQVDGLPATLPGPVAVVVTMGANDMQAALPQILANADQGARAAMGQNIQDALASLLAPGRFGAGVEVRVLHANVYDPTDGTGNYAAYGCSYGVEAPSLPTATFVASWNAAITAAVTSRGQSLVDIHALFTGHGYAGNPRWFVDCSHPNALGHAALAGSLARTMTGT